VNNPEITPSKTAATGLKATVEQSSEESKGGKQQMVT
jgi:hypothetical protein